MEQRRFGNRESSFFPTTLSPEIIDSTPYSSSPRRTPLPEGDPLNPFCFFADQNQTLESALSRLNLWPDFRHQASSPSRSLPPNVDDVALQESGPSMCHYYSSGYAGQEMGNVGLQGGWMGLQNGGGQDLGFGGAHPNLMMGQRAWNCGTGDSALRSVVPRESMCGNDYLRLNAALNNGNHQEGVYADGGSFLQSKKSSPRRFDAQFLNSLHPNQNGTFTEDLDGLLYRLVLNSRNIVRPEHKYDLGEEFESLSLQDLRGRIVLLAKDQNGSRILQEKMERPHEGDVEMVVSEVVDYVADLMKNQFGSYFLQKLFRLSSEEQRTRIIMALTKNSYQLVGICLNSHGGRAMQKMLENLITPEQISLVISALCHGVVRLASDPNGQHVVRHCVINYSSEYNKHLLNEVANNCFEIATDKSGCCVLQCCVENARGETREHLIKEIIANALHLAEDRYGNYVVQHLLSQNMPGVAAQLLGQLRYHFATMSCNKYASNVVEKFLTESGDENSTMIIIELLNSPNAAMLLLDPYGNFVIQTALSVSKGYVYQQLSNLILDNAQSLRSNLYGRKVLSWFEKKKPQYA